MFNLTHDESSAVDIGGIWTGPDEFELTLRFNHDDQDDLIVNFILSREEVEQFADYLQMHLSRNRIQ
tara:strand:- start:507 stop:707 length:201 start_codon:yes stop_codon:yes gene_type:complete